MAQQDKPGNRKKTKFEPVKKEPPQQQEPPPPRPQQQPPPKQPPPPPEPLTLRVLEAGQSPHGGGLSRDANGSIVGPHGLVLVYKRPRFVALLSALSHAFDLSAGLQVETPHADTYLLLLTPPDPTVAPSRFYETVRGAIVAARLSPRRTHLCVGDGRIFVPVAHPDAPHGYDVAGQAPAQGRVVVLPQGVQHFPTPHPLPLLDALGRVPLEATREPHGVTTLSVLTDRRMAALVAGYVQRHGLDYRVRFLTWQQGERLHQAALFDLVTAGTVRPIPPFVITFLQRLLHTTLLTDALEQADLESEPPGRVLVAWGQRTPLYLPHIERLLPIGGALILAGHPWGTALVDSLPPRQHMQQLTRVEAPDLARVAVSTHPAGHLRLPIAFVRDSAVRGPIHGLLLDDAALHRLRRLVRRLPAPWFAHARVALGDGVALLIAPDAPRGIEGIPIGYPLARTSVERLLLPRSMALRPTLPPDLLTSALALQEDTLTVLTPTGRYDAPLDAFEPVPALLALDMPAQPVAIRVQTVPLPTIDLRDLREAPPPAVTTAPPPAEPAQPKSGLKSIVQGLMGTRQPPAERPTDLRQHAAHLQQQGHYAAAALFYDYLGDHGLAMECYQHAADAEEQEQQ